MNDTQVSWDEFDVPTEAVTKEDFEGTTRDPLPNCRVLATCLESNPRIWNKDNDSLLQANLKFTIDRVYEVDGEAISQEESQKFEGRFFWDSISMEHGNEPQWSKNRRINIAKGFGLINGPEPIPKEVWTQGVVNKQVKVVLEQNTYEDKISKEEKVRTGPKFFNGYEKAVQTGDTDSTNPSEYADI